MGSVQLYRIPKPSDAIAGKSGDTLGPRALKIPLGGGRVLWVKKYFQLSALLSLSAFEQLHRVTESEGSKQTREASA